jgi:ubiquinol-cytochrome c reductase cytochrome c1 subunit
MKLRFYILFSAIFLAPLGVNAAAKKPLMSANNDIYDIESLQRGARNFMNYCSGCHSAEYIRYDVIGEDLGITQSQLKEYLMFNAQQTFDTINASMTSEDASGWFGQAPPDLSLAARAKGTDYIYTFLKSFYVDNTSPTGVDNVVLAGTSMPNVLWELQGHQKYSQNEDESKLEVYIPGKMNEEEFNSFLRDTSNFLEYISEPVKVKRQALGVKVLFFLAFFMVLAYFLKKEVWKDIK